MAIEQYQETAHCDDINGMFDDIGGGVGEGGDMGLLYDNGHRHL